MKCFFGNSWTRAKNFSTVAFFFLIFFIVHVIARSSLLAQFLIFFSPPSLPPSLLSGEKCVVRVSSLSSACFVSLHLGGCACEQGYIHKEYIYIIYIIHNKHTEKKMYRIISVFLHCHFYYCINFRREAFLGVGLVFDKAWKETGNDGKMAHFVFGI